LNERLRKLQRFGVLQKKEYSERPPRVEYDLTRFHSRIKKILDEIPALDRERRNVAWSAGLIRLLVRGGHIRPGIQLARKLDLYPNRRSGK
jgi:hypothetical protein